MDSEETYINTERNSTLSRPWQKSLSAGRSLEFLQEIDGPVGLNRLLPQTVRLVLVVLLLGVLLTACSFSCRAPVIANADEKPMVFVYATPAYPLPGKPVVAGIVCAVWRDGTIVRCFEGTIGPEYVEGTLRGDELQAIERILETIKSGKGAGNSAIAVDAGAEQITVRIDNRPITRIRDPAKPVADPFWQLREMLLGASIEGAENVVRKEYQEYPHSWYE